VPAGAIIPFEVGGQQFSEFPHHANLAANTDAAESPACPTPSRGRRKLPSLDVAEPTAEQEGISRNKPMGKDSRNYHHSTVHISQQPIDDVQLGKLRNTLISTL
jgi:hypothetical protein